MAKILVTGATGFIGSHTLDPLVGHGHDVHAVSSKPQAGTGLPQNVTWHQADLFDEFQRKALVTRVKATYLLHLAWYVEPGKLIGAHENFDWVAHSMNLVRDFHEAGGERVVCSGSCYEYNWTGGSCSETSTPTGGDSIYGATKNALGKMIEAYANATDLSAAWARLFFLYGPHENPKRLVSSIVLSLLDDRPAKCSHGRQVRDYCHVQDVADGIVALLESDHEGALNIATGDDIRIRDIATTIGEIMGKQELIVLGALPARPSDVPVVRADVTKSREILDWRPKFDLNSGLRQTIEWWHENRERGHA